MSARIADGMGYAIGAGVWALLFLLFLLMFWPFLLLEALMNPWRAQ